MRRFVVLFLALAACLAAAQDNDQTKMLRTGPPRIDPQAEALLVKMRSVYSSVKSAKVSSTFEELGPEGRKVSLTSKSVFKAPSSFRIVSHGLPKLASSGYLLVTDGKRVFVDGLPSGSISRDYNVREMRRNLPHLNLEVMCFYDWERQLSRRRNGFMQGSTFKVFEEAWKGKKYTILEETNRRQEVRVKYFLDPKTVFIWKVEVFRLTDAIPYLTTTIEAMEINVPIESGTFREASNPAAAKPVLKGNRVR